MLFLSCIPSTRPWELHLLNKEKLVHQKDRIVNRKAGMLSNNHKNHTPPETEAGHYFNGQTLQGHRSVFRMMHDAITFCALTTTMRPSRLGCARKHKSTDSATATTTTTTVFASVICATLAYFTRVNRSITSWNLNHYYHGNYTSKTGYMKSTKGPPTKKDTN